MNKTKALIGLAILALIIFGAYMGVSKGNNQGIEFSPNMYVSDGYEPYSQEQGFQGYNPHQMTMRMPVKGSVARGQSSYAYPYPGNADGYKASASYTNWVPKTKSNNAEGQRLYTIYCAHCHGATGGNDGSIFKSEKIGLPASFPDGYTNPYIQNIPEGQIYHTLVHGKGAMGSHAAMLSPDERWKVINYVKELSLGADYQFAPESAGSTSTHAASSMMYGDDVMSANASAEGGSPMSGASLSRDEQESVRGLLSKVMFKGPPNRKEFAKGSTANLDKIAAILKERPGTLVHITGFTGTTLTDGGADRLGRARADAVAQYLIKQGVSSGSLKTFSKGRAGGGDNKANRKVEISFLKR